MAKVWQPSDNGFMNSKGEIGIWVDAPDPIKPVQKPVSQGQGGGQQAYFNQILAWQREQMERERAERERIKQGRIDAANRVYNTGVNNLNNATADAQRQAYIKRMQDEKAMPQQLQAMGISGGATESTLAGIKTAYGNNRAEIEKARLNELGQLEQEKLNAIAAAEADMANAEIAANRDYTNGLIQSYASFIPKSSGRSSGSGSSTQSVTKTDGYKRAAYLLNQGYSSQEIANELERQGYSENLIASYLGNLGLL